MKLKLSLPYEVREGDRNSPLYSTDRKISDLLIRGAIQQKFPGGVKEKSARSASSQINKALVRALKNDLDEVEIDELAVKFIKDAFNDFGVHPDLTHWLEVLEDHVEEVLKPKKAEEKSEPKP